MTPSLSTAAATFLAVLPAELPDKTILACLILSSRYRPWYVFSGAAAAFLVQVTIGVAAGGAISLLPHRPVAGAAAAVFAVSAFLLWRHKEEENPDADEEGGPDGVRAAFWPVFGTSFAVVFLAEFGDLTQFMTVSLAARFHDPIAVGVGRDAGAVDGGRDRGAGRLAAAQADSDAVADQGRGGHHARPRGHQPLLGAALDPRA